jgi:hypothetical protein
MKPCNKEFSKIHRQKMGTGQKLPGQKLIWYSLLYQCTENGSCTKYSDKKKKILELLFFWCKFK